MKLHFSKEELNKVYDLLSQKELNISFADMYLCLFNDPTAIKEDDINIEVMEKEISRKEAYISLFANYLELDMNNKENIELIDKFVKPSIEEIDINEYKNNPYYKTIKSASFKDKEYELTYDHYEPYELIPLDEIKVDYEHNFEEYSTLAFSSNRLDFLALKQNQETWMCITPNEINTMKQSVNEARGDVLVFGLGLGYYPFMISLKEEVRNITIIEKDKTIISLFKKHLLSLFPYKNKITIIEDDAYHYLLNNKKKYDYAFVDLWHNPNDGLPIYLKFKSLEKTSNIKQFSYWIETSMKALYIRCFLIVLEEQLHGSTDKDYKYSENDIDVIINNLYFQTKNIHFYKKEDVINYINNKLFIY